MSNRNLRIESPENSSTGSEKYYQFQLNEELPGRKFELIWRAVNEPENWIAEEVAEELDPITRMVR